MNEWITQPNARVNPTHWQLWYRCVISYHILVWWIVHFEWRWWDWHRTIEHCDTIDSCHFEAAIIHDRTMIWCHRTDVERSSPISTATSGERGLSSNDRGMPANRVWVMAQWYELVRVALSHHQYTANLHSWLQVTQLLLDVTSKLMLSVCFYHPCDPAAKTPRFLSDVGAI